jgi:hypothetical protein
MCLKALSYQNKLSAMLIYVFCVCVCVRVRVRAREATWSQNGSYYSVRKSGIQPLV